MLASASADGRRAPPTLCVGSGRHLRLVPPRGTRVLDWDRAAVRVAHVLVVMGADQRRSSSTSLAIRPHEVSSFILTTYVCTVLSTQSPARDRHGPTRLVRRADGAAQACESHAKVCCVVLFFFSSLRRYARHGSGLRMRIFLLLYTPLCVCRAPRPLSTVRVVLHSERANPLLSSVDRRTILSGGYKRNHL